MGILLSIGRIDLLLGVCVRGEGFKLGCFYWIWSLFIFIFLISLRGFPLKWSDSGERDYFPGVLYQ